MTSIFVFFVNPTPSRKLVGRLTQGNIAQDASMNINAPNAVANIPVRNVTTQLQARKTNYGN